MSFQFFLASSSPRRKDLINLLKFPYQVHAPEVDEALDQNLSLVDQCLYLADLKAEKSKSDILKLGIAKKGIIILSADTLVGLDQKKFEKPKDSREAKEMLTMLSGRTHRVVTGLCFIYSQDQVQWKKEKIFAETRVSFHPLSTSMINTYVDTREGLDKAGGYGIQGFAQSFVSKIEGTFSNVVGLPLDLVVQFLETKISTGKLDWQKLIF